MNAPDLGALVRSIIDANLYMVLATAESTRPREGHDLGRPLRQ